MVNQSQGFFLFFLLLTFNVDMVSFGMINFKEGNEMEDLESDGYYHLCKSCNHRFDYISDYCPNCGSEDMKEDGVIFDYGTLKKQEKE